jgi:Ca2+-transporting ATPase
VLAFTQMFEVMAIHAGDRLSFIKVRFKTNRWLFWAVLSTFILQLLVIYVPVLQVTLDTAPLSLTELVVASILGAVVLVAVEIEKALMRRGATHQSA